jgi:ribosome maturation protein SDO1
MDQRKTYEKEHFNLNIARLKKNGQTFEINIDPDLAILFKEGKNIDIKDILKSEDIFFDVKKGELASETIMQNVFGTQDSLEVAKIILKQGEIQLTAEHRKKVREQKRNKIIQTIHRNAINPRTDTPIPIKRIENAFEEGKIKIKEYVSAENQIDDIIKKLQPIISIRFETKKIELKVSAKHAHTIYGVINKYGKITQNNWLNDGSWYGIVEIPAGLQNEFFDEINNKTHGKVICKIVE